MNNLINRNEAIDAINHIREVYVNNLPTLIDKASVQAELMMLPPAQPTLYGFEPELIHCKDCKHYDGRPCGKVDWYNSAGDYCSRAERKE